MYNTAGYFSPKNPSAYSEIVRRAVAPCSVQISQTYWHSLPACIFPFLHGWVSAPMQQPVKLPVGFQSAQRDQGQGWERSCTPSLQCPERCPLSACHPPPWAGPGGGCWEWSLLKIMGWNYTVEQKPVIKRWMALDVFQCIQILMYFFNFSKFFCNGISFAMTVVCCRDTTRIELLLELLSSFPLILASP